MKAIGYARTTGSEERNAAQRSVDEQELILRAFAREHGLSFVGVHRDTGLGQGDRSTRAGLMALLDSMQDGWDLVLVCSLDRIATKDVTLDVLQELRENGKRWQVLTEAQSQTCLEAGRRWQAREPQIERERRERKRSVALAGDDRARVAERLLRGREAGARAGKHQSGPAPYGYRRDYEARLSDGVLLRIDEEESQIVKFIFREYLRVRSMKRLIELLEARRCRTRRGKRWSRAGVSWILKNDTYVGRVHFGQIRTRGRHVPIVSPIIFNKVQKLIRKNDKRKKVAATAEAATAPALAGPVAPEVAARTAPEAAQAAR
ncbi:recombinase family protein [bacterium]|nr:recombinase family protein [bacterium]